MKQKCYWRRKTGDYVWFYAQLDNNRFEVYTVPKKEMGNKRKSAELHWRSYQLFSSGYYAELSERLLYSMSWFYQ